MSGNTDRLSAALGDRYRIEHQLGEGAMALRRQPTAISGHITSLGLGERYPMPENTDRLTAALHDRCRVERELGAGGMATVYLADDLKHDRKVALKVLRPELAAVLGADRFVQEIGSAIHCGCVSIVHRRFDSPFFSRVTPDGNLLAFTMDGESGQRAAYVQSLPGPGPLVR